MDNNCKECKYKHNIETNEYECRRFPPVKFTGTTRWPALKRGDSLSNGCGEFVKREKDD